MVKKMREILFRGKQIDADGWAYGVPVEGTDIDESEILIIESVFDCEEYLCRGCEFSPIIPETLGQYTGLRDNTRTEKCPNGKKIFEGDILKSVFRWLDMPKNGVVAFRDGAFGFIWYRGDIEMFHPFTSVCNVTYEVIGNIHDNPELLKGDAEG